MDGWGWEIILDAGLMLGIDLKNPASAQTLAG